MNKKIQSLFSSINLLKARNSDNSELLIPFVSFILLIFFLSAIPVGTVTAGCPGTVTYCIPLGNTNIFGNGYVTEFKITDPSSNVLIDQIGVDASSCCNYIDNTGVGTPNLTPGVTYTISGSRQDDGAFLGEPDPFNYGMNIWIDYNNDGVFDNTAGSIEIVYTEGLSEIDAFSFTYTVPTSGITAGIHRLRIRTHYNDPNPDPCANLSSGAQGMDFLVNIVCTHTVSISAGSESTVCTGNSINLSSNPTAGNAPFSYTWCGPNGFTSIQQNPIRANAVLADSGTYTVILADSNGCNASATMEVVVNQTPTSGASSNSPLCSGSNLNLSSSGGASYAWTGPNSFTSSQQNPVITNVAAVDSGIYIVSVTGASGCTSSASTTVVIGQTLSANASSNTPVCSASALNLSSGGGVSYSWSGPNGFTSTQQNPVVTNVALADSGSYTVTISASGGCTASASTPVTVKQSPTASASSNTPVCEGSGLTLSSSGGASYSWTGPNSFTSTQQNPTITTASSAAAGTYTVTVNGANGCTTTANAAVVVNALPTAGAGSNKNPVCYGDSLDLFSSGGVSYSWMGPNSFSSTLQNPVILNAISVDSGTYIVTVAGANGCTATASINEIIFPPLTAPSITQSGDTLKCGTDPSYTSYQWFYDSIPIPGAINSSYVISQGGNFNVQVSNENGCKVAVGGIYATPEGIPNLNTSGVNDNLVSLYPNPANNQLTINTSFSYNYDAVTIVIMNVLGEVMQTEKIKTSPELSATETNYTINIANLPSGIYFLQMKLENGGFIRRFVKE